LIQNSYSNILRLGVKVEPAAFDDGDLLGPSPKLALGPQEAARVANLTRLQTGLGFQAKLDCETFESGAEEKAIIPFGNP
jgi:hypothetical protein